MKAKCKYFDGEKWHNTEVDVVFGGVSNGVPFSVLYFDPVSEFDSMTAAGYKLNLITGEYYKP